jgi:hypothetical protein
MEVDPASIRQGLEMEGAAVKVEAVKESVRRLGDSKETVTKWFG